jgi:dTDP-glucose 4,6-dehydratase
MTRILIVGGDGFIGSHLREYVNQTTDWEVSAIEPDYIVHLAGCSQIDESISHPVETVSRDIETTLKWLEFSRHHKKLKKFLYFSSDEVFGPKEVVEDFKPWDRYNSHSPYAAAKAACEEMCLAWASTYGVPIVITHCQNLIGERQPANKFLPTVVRYALKGESVPIFCDPRERLPRRNYLHVRDAVRAVVVLLAHAEIRQKYNIARDEEFTGFEIVHAVSKIMGVEIALNTVHPTNAFQLRYGLDGRKLKEFGWRPRPLMESLSETVLWLIKPENRHWLGL